jgi:hypothetical protein
VWAIEFIDVSFVPGISIRRIKTLHVLEAWNVISHFDAKYNPIALSAGSKQALRIQLHQDSAHNLVGVVEQLQEIIMF